MIPQLVKSSLILFAATICFSFTTVQDLTLEEKIGQLLMVHFHGETANQEAKTAIQDLHVGGVIYYNWANGLSSPAQVEKLSSSLQALARIPLLIAVDQEGGIVARLVQGFTVFPGNKALAMTERPDLAEKSAYAIGEELLSVGVNMNLAPVVDINTNPKNPVIGLRSFGETRETVISFGKKALEGYHKVGVMSCLKHFPGHGDISIDSHYDLPVLHKSLEELRSMELLPFEALAKEADTIMTAHLLVPAFDPDHCSTLSKKTLDYLRNQIGFQGVILSDSLVMEGVLKRCGGSVDTAAIQAFNAGCDMLILGGKQLTEAHLNLELTIEDVRRIHEKLVLAVKNGEISEEALDRSVERILKLKEKYLHAAPKVQKRDYQELSLKIASLALKTTWNDPTCLQSLKEKNIGVIAPLFLKESVEPLLHVGKQGKELFFTGLNPIVEEVARIKAQATSMDMLVICSYNAWKNPAQAALIQALLEEGKPVLLVVMRDPLDAALFPKASIIYTTFSQAPSSIQAICKELK